MFGVVIKFKKFELLGRMTLPMTCENNLNEHKQGNWVRPTGSGMDLYTVSEPCSSSSRGFLI
jgi:hypothetical protein